MPQYPMSILDRFAPGTNMFIWFDSSGFMFARFEGISGSTAEFLVGGSLLLRINIYAIKAVLT